MPKLSLLMKVSFGMGTASSTVSDILRGNRGIGPKHIEAFATYFHVSPAVFLNEPS
jgi:antitoxin component HigA of HigAB toxin-antitoxin module